MCDVNWFWKCGLSSGRQGGHYLYMGVADFLIGVAFVALSTVSGDEVLGRIGG